MDTIIYSVLRITVMILILRTLFRLFSYPKVKSFRINKNHANNDMAAQSTSNENAMEEKAPIELVTDTENGREIPKHQAYILLDNDDQRHYFGTWEGRQKYIAAQVK